MWKDLISHGVDFTRLHTPCFILDEEHLRTNFDGLTKAFGSVWGANLIIGYSVKTNSLPWVLCWMRENGAYAEVVSEHEFYLARKGGFCADKIIYNGPVKGEQSFFEALNSGGIVNLDSFSEIEMIKHRKPENGGTWKVGLRFNFDLEKLCPGETIVGSEVGRFGFNLENGSLYRAIAELEDMGYVKVIGLHAHNSTKTKSLRVFKTLCEKCREISDKTGIAIEYVDLGGCFFGDKPNTPSFSEYATIISAELRKSKPLCSCTLIMEPGTALIATPFSYLTSVVDIKDCLNERIVTTDGSCIHIDPQMHGIRHNKIFLSDSQKRIDRQILAGFTCIEKDRFDTIQDELELRTGDKILFEVTGAYTLSLSPLFIQYFPSVYVLKDGKFKNVRKAWDVNDYMKKCEVF